VPLEVDAFRDTDRYLRVWFSRDGVSYQQLSPDRRVAAVPYALQAQEAANADTVDGYDGASLEESAEIDADIAAHTAIADAHHARYTDAEAWAAVLANDGPGSGLQADLAPRLDRVTAPANSTLTTLDDTGDVGEHTSVTIGTDGLPLISYYDATNGALKVAHCDDTACTSAEVHTLDVYWSQDTGQNTSMTIGADGLPLISYSANGELWVAHCSNIVCSHTDIHAPGYGVDNSTSVTVGADGLPVISYSYAGLWVAHCTDVACSSVTREVPDMDWCDGTTAMTIGVDGLPLVVYSCLGELRVAHCNDTACAQARTTELSNNGQYQSVTIGADGLPLISYYENVRDPLEVFRLVVAHCSEITCGLPDAWTILETSDVDHVGMYTSVTIGADNLPLISYYHENSSSGSGHLKVAHCTDTTCSSAVLATVDNSAPEVGRFTAVTIGADGLPLIAYYDFSNQDLKAAHCSNVFCTPYFRRR
jgi:hypothetical protein